MNLIKKIENFIRFFIRGFNLNFPAWIDEKYKIHYEAKYSIGNVSWYWKVLKRGW